MATFKKINSDNISTIPYEANKQYNLDYSKLTNVCQSGSSDDVSILTGRKISTGFVADLEPMTANHYQKSVYNTINKLYYNKFSSSFDYDSNRDLIKNFPMLENSFIRVIQIPQSKFGNNIQPNEFTLISESYNIRDDGSGNLFDENYTQKVHVGNIFYNQGLAIITNQDYNCIFPIEPVVFNKFASFYTHETKVIDLLSDSISYCGQNILPNSVEIINQSEGFTYTLSNGVLTFTQNVVGNYYAQFFVKDSLNICSNIVTINIEIKSDCDFDLQIVSGSQSQSECVSTIADFELIKVPKKDCQNYSNNIDGYLIEVFKLSKRINGIRDFRYTFNSNKKVNWDISIDGGLTYFSIASDSNKIEFTTELSNQLNYLKNSFFYILRLSVGESFTEYKIKANPITEEYEFDKIKEYLDINLISKDCLLNHYKVITNNCDITSINWSFTDEMSGVVVAIDEIILLGCRGNVIAEIESRCCPTTTKVLTFNGNCIEPSCLDSKIELEIFPTNFVNNYIIFANTNFYLKEYPNWKFFGNVEYLSNVYSNYIEIQLNTAPISSKISYEAKDFCRDLYAEHLFNRVNEVLLTTQQISTTTFKPPINREIATADLELNIYSNNNFPTKNELIQINILIQNKGYIDATDVVVKLEFDNLFSINENSLLKYLYQKYDGIFYINIDTLKIGEYFSIKFDGTVLGEIGSTVNIKSQIFQVDQIDIDSEPNNGYENGEDDAKILQLNVKKISNTTVSTTFSCTPVIRDYPYTNTICSVYNDYRGSIIINAINPFTNDSTEIEYSFLGDIDKNYQEKNISNLLDNGLYEVFVRLKNNKTCKSSTKVRISCLNGEASTDWILNGNACIN